MTPELRPDDRDVDLLQQVRDQCAEVAEGARWVRIDTEALSGYVDRLDLAGQAVPVFDDRHHYRGEPELTVLAVLCLDAVNFGSGWFPRFRKRAGLSGYFTVAECLRDWFTTAPPTVPELCRLSEEQVGVIFEQRGNPLVDDLMRLFTTGLNQLGRLLVEQYAGDPVALVRAADRRAARLTALLRAMPMFDDVASWRGRPVSFFKRAQLTAVDLALALPGAGFGDFTDLDRLTIFADNLVPHVLQVDRILHYDEELAATIDAGKLLPAGSEPEVELRATAIHAVELMVQQLAGAASAADLDFLLWNRGQERRYRDRPRHRTETWFY